MRFHRPSLAAGAVLAIFAGIITAQNIVNSPTIEVVVRDPMIVEGIPFGRDMVRIESGVPFVVPSDRMLVLRSICRASLSSTTQVKLRINSAVIYEENIPVEGVTFDPGIPVSPSSTVELGVLPAGEAAALLGYLADN